MSYTTIPTRDTNDSNSFADINQLQTNISTFGGSINSITANLSITSSDDYGFISVNSAAGTATVVLPTLTASLDKEIIIYHSTGGNDAEVDGSAAETIEGLAKIVLPKAGDRVRVKATASEWKIIEENISCQLRLHTSDAGGSTDTAIEKFTTSVDDYGNMFTHNHGSYGTDGLEVTIARSGNYNIVYTTNYSGNDQLGISLDSSQLTTNIANITTADRLCSSGTNAAVAFCVQWSGYLVANSIVRPHGTPGQLGSGTDSRSNFTISYEGN